MGKYTNNKYSGFSLVELSIALVIVGFMIAGTLTVVKMQTDAANVSQTNAKLDKIERAIQLYYETSGFLPCPAEPTLTSTSANFGLGRNGETATSNPSVLNSTGATCTGAVNISGAYLGAVPTRTLSLPDDFMFDAWGNRFTYVVTIKAIDDDNWLTLGLESETSSTHIAPITSAFGCIDGGLSNVAIANVPANHNACGALVLKDNATPTPNNRMLTDINGGEAINAIYVLISHGKNGFGAYSRTGTRITTGAATANAEELDNASLDATAANAYDVNFRDDRIIDIDGLTLSYFDDIVRWKLGSQIQYEKENN